jgi:hypothetical protein
MTKTPLPLPNLAYFPRRGRRNNSPPQFGHFADIASVQGGQNVHSKLQM